MGKERLRGKETETQRDPFNTGIPVHPVHPVVPMLKIRPRSGIGLIKTKLFQYYFPDQNPDCGERGNKPMNAFAIPK